MVVHHIAADHWSAGVLFADLMTAYRARRADKGPSWAPLPVQYADYAAWQGAFLSDASGAESSVAGAQREYWIRQLEGLPEDTGLRPDFPGRRCPAEMANPSSSISDPLPAPRSPNGAAS